MVRLFEFYLFIAGAVLVIACLVTLRKPKPIKHLTGEPYPWGFLLVIWFIGFVVYNVWRGLQ